MNEMDRYVAGLVQREIDDLDFRGAGREEELAQAKVEIEQAEIALRLLRERKQGLTGWLLALRGESAS